jgi:hypothetical protein
MWNYRQSYRADARRCEPIADALVYLILAGVQREIWRGTTLNFAWNHRGDYQQLLVLNQAVTASAWTPQTITNPLDGTPITVFNLSPSYFGLAPAIHQTNAPQSLRANVYNGYETSLTARLPRRMFVFAGWTIRSGCRGTIARHWRGAEVP